MVTLKQDIEDRECISGVVWDAGMLLADYIVWEAAEEAKQQEQNEQNERSQTLPSHFAAEPNERETEPRYILDLGCGTGIVGVVASVTYQGAKVSFSDLPSVRRILEANLTAASAAVKADNAAPALLVYVPYDWCSPEPPPAELLSPMPVEADGSGDKGTGTCTGTSTAEVEPEQHPEQHPEQPQWHTVFCSDVLYDEQTHAPLMKLLRQLRFRRCIFGFKRRHPQAELAFFQQLRVWCDVRVLHLEEGSLVNCTAAMTKAGGGLFAVLVTRRADQVKNLGVATAA